jgi:hypothetical protein
VWTIEWFDETKRRVLTETSSTQHIQDAQPYVQHVTKTKHKKRKLNTEYPTSTTSSLPQPNQPLQIEFEDGAAASEIQVQPLQQLAIDTELEVNNETPERDPPGRGTTPQPPSEQTAKREADMADTHPLGPSTHGPSIQPMGNEQRLYFLLRPRTSTSRHVLIPLTSSHTLAESLHGRTVLEFPTIYVFPTSVQGLPEEFMLEEEYVRLEGEEQKEFDELMKELDPDILRRLKEGDGISQSDRGAGEEEIDDKKILDVLKQDLGGRL